MAQNRTYRYKHRSKRLPIVDFRFELEFILDSCVLKRYGANRCAISILGRLPLHVIDYQNRSGSLLQLQLQSQLLTDGVGKRKCPIRIRRATGLAGTLKAVLQNADCAKTQRES